MTIGLDMVVWACKTHGVDMRAEFAGLRAGTFAFTDFANIMKNRCGDKKFVEIVQTLRTESARTEKVHMTALLDELRKDPRCNPKTVDVISNVVMKGNRLGNAVQVKRLFRIMDLKIGKKVVRDAQKRAKIGNGIALLSLASATEATVS